MNTIECPIALPPSCTTEALKALEDELWRSASTSARRTLSSARDVFTWIRNLNLDRLERSLWYLDKLTIKVRNRVLDVVADLIGFLVEVAADGRLDGAEWRLFYDDKDLKVSVKDDCRRCKADASETSVPKSHPEFCSEECALAWLDDKSEQLAKFEDLDATIADEIEKALERNKKDVEAEIKEAIADSAFAVLDSAENLVLEVIRAYSYKTIEIDVAARKLEALFRSGKLSL